MEGVYILCFTALSTLVALCFVKFSGGKSKAKLPPGPWTLPMIGSLHHVISKVPHRKMFELSRRYGPVMFLKLGETPTVVVSSAEAASLMLKTNDLAFSDRTRSVTFDIFGCDGKDIAFAPYGDHWRQMRKVCVVELLSAKQVRRMEDIRTDEVGSLLRSITAGALDGTMVNFSKKVSALSNDVVSRAVFGGKFRQQDEYISELDKAFTLVSGSSLVDLFPSSQLVRWFSNGEREVRKVYDGIQRIIAEIVDERKATSHGVSSTDEEDLLGALLRLQREDTLQFPLTTDVMGAVLFDIFAGGTDTSASVLEWTMTELVTNPRIMAKAQQEIRQVLGEHRTVITNSDLAGLHYMQNVIKEVLRLHPPVPLFARAAREDCNIMGYDILKGTDVFVSLFAISREERYWENPEEFKPERFKNNSIDYHGSYAQYIPFGAGRRQCPGMVFATSTVDIVLANLLYHFDWKLPDGVSIDSLDKSENFRLTVSRKYDLELKAIPHVWPNGIPSK
ncbi:zealexin A1 synthase-like [Lolium rigidum]|uniref:zealexin A1 synthase-like n=1 Tax=Lolium rigidum TaxID=89674 RepID=UPI001F5E33E8|nr:zealexin A1 synthase-like [Lolium rigidum]